MLPDTLRVGITGGIGSGKTYVSKIFEVLGIDVYYADERAKWLQVHNSALVQQIREAFGSQAYKRDGQLNRTFLADQVFSDPEKLTLLNGFVHPQVAKDYRHWVAQRTDHPYTVKEAALLFETEAYQQVDKIITVNAPVAVRMQRVMRRDPQRTQAQLKRIIAQQLSDAERSQRADYTIDNSGTTLVAPQVVRIHHRFIHNTVA